MYWGRSESDGPEDDMYYVIKKLTNISPEEADEIRQKRDAHRAKKKMKKE